jgi:hypothetical protein
MKQRDEKASRRGWKRPAIKAVGKIGDVVKGGGGKMTVVTGDPGEPQKVSAMDK